MKKVHLLFCLGILFVNCHFLNGQKINQPTDIWTYSDRETYSQRYKDSTNWDMDRLLADIESKKIIVGQQNAASARL